MNLPDLKDWICLIGSENVGPSTFRYLLQRYGSAKEALKALPLIAKRGGKSSFKIPDVAFADNQLQQAEKNKAIILTWEDPEYPAYLKATETAPPILYIKGNTKLFFKKQFAMVGSRNASLNGIKFTRDLSAELGDYGLSIVSGLALGIDSAAHQGALESGTIAVLGGGLDTVYPSANADLQSAISDQGLIVSEFSFGTPPAAHHFPQRNRIIAGLSAGILVVEARYQSGSMITATYANEFGRDIFAVPGFPYDPRSEGPNKLIKEGASLVRSAEDIIHELSAYIDTVHAFNPKDYFPAPGPEVKGLAEMKAKIMNLLSATPVDVDAIIRHTKLSPAYVWDVILELELSGAIQRHSGNKVSLKS
jgi:DNA processing protein